MQGPTLGHHISRRFDEDLERVRARVLEMGGLVEAQLGAAVNALIASDHELGARAARQDHTINAMEVAIDEECQRLLAIRSPTASDLRLVVAIIKTITDLERIGDEGQKVAYIASRLVASETPADHYRHVKHLARLALHSVHEALDSFARLDADAALGLSRDDRVLDREYEAVQRQGITLMLEDPRAIRRVLDVLWVARALERIGDHAKNIGEYVIYMVYGKDIRHTKLEEIERALHPGPEPQR
jgi:phosphate transport system protein